jgi:hypothetical protein
VGRGTDPLDAADDFAGFYKGGCARGDSTGGLAGGWLVALGAVAVSVRRRRSE